jgi:hypothetical protein
MGRNVTEVVDYLNAIITEASKSYGGSFRDGCLAIEAGLKTLDKQGDAVLGFTLGVSADGVAINTVVLADPDGMVPAPRPEDLTFDGVWAVLYSLAMPRHSPFFKDPLRISAITICHGRDPWVSYDRTHENGLPMAMDRPFDAEKLDLKPKAPHS